MKNNKNFIYLIALIIVMLFAALRQTEKYFVDKKEVILVYQKGYFEGCRNVIGNAGFDPDQYRLDSLVFINQLP